MVDLNNRTFETSEGTWRTEYIGEPRENGDNVEYRIRFKWVNPQDPKSRATPERWITLLTYDSQTIGEDYEGRLMRTLLRWLDSPEEADATFDYELMVLLSRDRS